jgi:hypothetical protein
VTVSPQFFAPLVEPVPAAPPAVAEHPFGEEVREGDLLVTVKEAPSGHYDYFVDNAIGQADVMMVHLLLKNTSAGKIAEWIGRPSGFKVEDEFGNHFAPVQLPSHDSIARPQSSWADRDGRFSHRINPGESYECVIYCQPLPPTTKQVKVTFPMGDDVQVFRGAIGFQPTEHDKALKAKEGQVLETGHLLADLAAGSKTIDADYPTGCKMRASGEIEIVDDKPGKEMVRLKDGSGGKVICFFDGKIGGNYPPGGTLSVQGVLRAVIPSAVAPQVHLAHCARAK